LFSSAKQLPPAGRRRPTSRFCVAGAGGLATVESYIGATAKLRQTTRTRRRYIAPGVYLPLFFSCCDSVAALPALVNYNGHVPKTSISRPHPLAFSALCTAPAAREVGVVKPLCSLARDTRARATGISFFSRAKIPSESLTFLPFLPLAPRLQAASSRGILHVQAGQCGN
jgi:hypothetical protein